MTPTGAKRLFRAVVPDGIYQWLAQHKRQVSRGRVRWGSQWDEVLGVVEGLGAEALHVARGLLDDVVPLLVLARRAHGLVVRGAVRLPATAASQLPPALDATLLVPGDLEDWRQLRAQLQERRIPRIMGRCFRSDPDGYLRSIEEELRSYLLA